jgi:hypothetical protein
VKEGGILGLAVLAQKIGSLLRTYWPAKLPRKTARLYVNDDMIWPSVFHNKKVLANFNIL